MESLPSTCIVLGTWVMEVESPAWGLALLCSASCSCPAAPHTGIPNPPNACFPSPAWQQVEQQLDGSQSGESACGPVQYVEKTPNPGLKGNWAVVVRHFGVHQAWCAVSS